MTDIYVRRSDDPDPRRRAAWLLLLLVLIGAGGFAGYRFGCDPAGDEEEGDELAQQVAEDPLVDELIEMTPEQPLVRPPVAAPPPPPKPEPEEEPDPEPEPPPGESAPTEEPPPPAEPAAGDPGIQLYTEARALVDDGALQEARDKALTLLQVSNHDGARLRAVDLLSEIGIQLVMTPRAMPEKVEYVVRSGDSLARIAKNYHTTIELIQKSNDISGTVIRVGDRLRILDAPFRLEIDKSDNILDLFLGDRFFKRYQVGTGKYNKTPVGDFKITDRIAQPPWWRPDGKMVPYGTPENELGTHWLSLDIRGYGLHGTWEPETIGQQASAGCVRLVNEEIEELYTLLPLGTQVSIRD